MKKENYKKIAKKVIDLEIEALKKLKNSLNNSFNQAVDTIVKCQSKTILCGFPHPLNRALINKNPG